MRVESILFRHSIITSLLCMVTVLTLCQKINLSMFMILKRQGWKVSQKTYRLIESLSTQGLWSLKVKISLLFFAAFIVFKKFSTGLRCKTEAWCVWCHTLQYRGFKLNNWMLVSFPLLCNDGHCSFRHLLSLDLTGNFNLIIALQIFFC